jgi:hypothetical protein
MEMQTAAGLLAEGFAIKLACRPCFSATYRVRRRSASTLSDLNDAMAVLQV